MPVHAKHRKIDELMAKAGEALGRRSCFETERLALKALLMGRQDRDFERMVRIVPLLQEARQQRLKQALDTRKVRLVDEPVTEDMKIERGCYLVQPPHVGADARRLRLAALAGETPVAVLCREPLTLLKQVPIVAIGPGATVRTKVDRPKNERKPDLAWFVSALEALGDWAIETLDAELTPLKRVDALLACLDAVPEHENLHQALAEACRAAAKHDPSEAVVDEPAAAEDDVDADDLDEAPPTPVLRHHLKSRED